MSIKGVIFDFDGTLANTNNLILATYRHVMSTKCGFIPSDEEIIATFGLPLEQGLVRISGQPEREQELRDCYRDFNLGHHDEMITIFPGVRELLAELKAKGFKTAIVTSKKPPMLERGLRCLDLVQYIDARVPVGTTKLSKPHADPSLYAARLLKLEPSECIVVGDSPFDLQSGHNAGMLAVAVGYSSFAKDKLIAEGQPDYIINNPQDLLNILDLLNQKEAEHA